MTWKHYWCFLICMLFPFRDCKLPLIQNFGSLVRGKKWLRGKAGMSCMTLIVALEGGLCWLKWQRRNRVILLWCKFYSNVMCRLENCHLITMIIAALLRSFLVLYFPTAKLAAEATTLWNCLMTRRQKQAGVYPSGQVSHHRLVKKHPKLFFFPFLTFLIKMPISQETFLFAKARELYCQNP